MTREEYVEKVAAIVTKHAPTYGIYVVSPILAQFCKESVFGTSELAVKANNHVGIKLKFKANGQPRTPIAIGGYNKKSGEYYNGIYSTPESTFARFNSLEDCVIAYFQFITSSSTYNGLKGVTDPKTYCELIAPYATDPNYSTSLYNDYILKYGFKKYDILNKEETKMIINVHAGHNPDGKVACGAIGLIKESTENRRVAALVISKLRALGHTVYDCTVDNGTSASDVLKKIVTKCNAHTVDLDISIHFNSGANDKSGNGKVTGTEIFVSSTSSKAVPYAQRVVRSISEMGYIIRDDAVKDDVKNGNYLYFIKNTKAPAMLIECCFVDDADDIRLYSPETMATAIVKGITGQVVSGIIADKDELYNQAKFIADVKKILNVVTVNEAFNKSITISKTTNKNNALVTPLERYMKALGYYTGSIEADAGKTPSFGSGMEKAIKAYQKEVVKATVKNQDGIISARGATWKKMLGV